MDDWALNPSTDRPKHGVCTPPTRGTYVKGSAPAPSATTGRWLVLTSGEEDKKDVLDALRGACPELDTIPCSDPIRPSLLNQFTAVIDLCTLTSDALIRSLLVRNMPVVAVNKESAAYSVNSVLMDTVLGATRLCRDLILAGHRRIAALEARGSTRISDALRVAGSRYGSQVLVEAAEAREAAALVDDGVTGLVCESIRSASVARAVLDARGIRVPDQVSLTAVGCGANPECSGYFVDARQIADAVSGLLKEVPLRPVALWMSPNWVDRGTLSPVALSVPLDQLVSHSEAHAIQ